MATKVRMVFKSDGFAALLQSDEVRADIERRAKAIADAAGDGFEAEMMDGSYGGSPRPIGVIAAKTWEARAAEATGKVLSSALDAGR